MDTADIASDHEIMNQNLAMLAHQHRYVPKGKIKEDPSGTTRYCEDCDKPIPARRLQVCPETTRCVLCQERFESEFYA